MVLSTRNLNFYFFDTKIIYLLIKQYNTWLIKYNYVSFYYSKRKCIVGSISWLLNKLLFCVDNILNIDG